ncbi:LD-carboxypeptidase [Corynebacterium liangguodongii]|uniref:LD-carboxypeptidase n=2 Tax=Corynebacterium liangguodongii TaxID=2079535 RepID=A0A2S0WGV0_9CORY|nr:LD-carboxypeptidase [Corynebacterium liangguodongii]PWC00681.1 LD-carboxypeptidase [Corynebacterium liangguodongii]
MTRSDIVRSHIAVVAPSLQAALIGPAVHKQAMRRITSEFGFPPVEYPSVREALSAQQRADDINSASTQQNCKAIFAVAGGNDSITLLKYLDRNALSTSRTPFVGYSDNTAIHNFLWKLGRTSYYGGSTQIQLGPGPSVDPIQSGSIKNVLKGKGSLELLRPSHYEVRGKDWHSPLALTEGGLRSPYPEYLWAGDPKITKGRSWGGCVQTLLQLAVMNELPTPRQLRDAILFLELSDEHLGDGNVLKLVRAFGEAGYFNAVGAILFGLPPHSISQGPAKLAVPNPSAATNLLSAVSSEIGRYNDKLPRVLGVPIGHLRPQYVIPYGGTIEVDSINRTVRVYYEPC